MQGASGFQGCLLKASSSPFADVTADNLHELSKPDRMMIMCLQGRPHLQPEECLQGGTALCGAVRPLQDLQDVKGSLRHEIEFDRGAAGH